MTSTEIVVSVDCQKLTTLPFSVATRPKTGLGVTFGKTAAAPIDGMLADVVISYR